MLNNIYLPFGIYPMRKVDTINHKIPTVHKINLKQKGNSIVSGHSIL